MSSVLDFVDFGSTFFGQPDKQRIKRQQYLTQNVDYYKQGLESTGIKVTDPERWSDTDTDEPKREVDISKVGVSEGGEDQDVSVADMANLSGGISNALSSSSSLAAINASFVDYNTSLQNAGFKDRSQSFLSKNFGISLAAPQSAKDIKEDIKGITVERAARSIGKKALGMLGFNPIATSLLSGFAPMTTVQDPLGNPSGRPNHAVMGTVMDINFSIQSNNISQSIAAMNANVDVPYSQRGPVGYFGYDPTNGQLISRAPLGKTWTGTTDLSIEQLSNLEALSKGFTTNGYNNQTERGENLAMATDTIGGQTIGGYGNNGFHHGINGSSRTGTMAQAEKAARGYGITTKQFTNILSTVRKNLTWNGKPKNSKLTVDYLSRKQFRDNESKGGSYSMGLETDVNAQQSIQDVISGKTAPSLSPSVGTSTSGGVGVSGDLGGATGAGYGAGSEGTDASSTSSTEGIDGPADAAASSSSSDGGESSDSGAESMGGEDVAYGGKIGNGFALGGRSTAEPAGFIGGPPENYSDETTIADDIPLKVKDGTFIINAPAVEYAGSIDIQKMLAEGYQKAMTRDIGVDKNFRVGKIPSREELDIQISRGEVVVPPHVAKAIGYDRLEKINNRGKREVERRQKAGNREKVQAGEGFAAKGGNFTTFTIDKVADAYKNKYPSASVARKQIKKLTRKMPLEDALAILIWGEAKTLGDEGLEGAAHVLMNRANAEKYPGFGKDIYDEITRTYKGSKGERIFEFNALEPTKFRETVKRFKQDPKTYARVRNIAEEVMAGARKDFTNNALFFWNPNTSGSDWYKNKVARKEFKETYRTVSPKNKKTLHVYHVPSDFKMDTFLKEEKVTPEQFNKEIPKPKMRPEEDRSDDGGGFIDYLRRLF